MVITGLTRNQLGSNPPRVRIPPSPPEKRHPIQDVFFISTPKRDGGIRRRALRKQSGGLFLAREQMTTLPSESENNRRGITCLTISSAVSAKKRHPI